MRRPRIWGPEARFESRILPLFYRRTAQVGDLLMDLYLHGLAQGDFELALRGLLGDGVPLSASSIKRLRADWEVEYARWRVRSLADRELAYAWADGVYVKAGLEKERAVLCGIAVWKRLGFWLPTATWASGVLQPRCSPGPPTSAAGTTRSPTSWTSCRRRRSRRRGYW